MGVHGSGVGGLVTEISSSLTRTTAPPVSGIFFMLSVKRFEWVGCFVMCFLVKVLMIEFLGSRRFYLLLQVLSELFLRELAAT